MIYSPNVPFFRTDRGDLLEEPWAMTILTSRAVYGDHLRVSAPDRLPAVPAVMAGRTSKLMAVAAEHHVTRFILGAWGSWVLSGAHSARESDPSCEDSGPFSRWRNRRASIRAAPQRYRSRPAAALLLA